MIDFIELIAAVATFGGAIGFGWGFGDVVTKRALDGLSRWWRGRKAVPHG